MLKFSPLLFLFSISGCYSVADAATENKIEIDTFTNKLNQDHLEQLYVPKPTIEPCYDWYLLKKEEIEKVEKETDKTD